MSINWVNYFLSGKHSRLTQGHIKADKLLEKILKHKGDTAYCCYFDLDQSALRLECWQGKLDKNGNKIYKYIRQNEPVPADSYKPEITFTAYDQDICRPALDLISFDFDSENAEDALCDVRKFIEWLGPIDMAIFFSGSKGFHIMIPAGYFGLAHSKELPYILRDLAKHLKEVYPTLDPSIYSYNHKFRVPFTKHEKTGLYKTYIHKDALELGMIPIRDYSTKREVFDFTANLKGNYSQLPQIKLALENSQKKSYEIKTDKAGSMIAPSAFEKYDGKKCIQRMLESRCEDVGRNNAALRLVNDFYRIGATRQKCEKAMTEWSKGNDLPFSEIQTIITNIYDRGQNYNFGCQDDIKSKYCSAKCVIYKKLDPDKRPLVVDSSETQFKEQEKSKKPTEKMIVDKLLGQYFKCSFDEKTNLFLSDGNIVKQGRDLFRYRAGRWHHMDEAKIDKLKGKIGELYEGHGNFKTVDQTFKLFLIHCPCVPEGVNMFSPTPNQSNFKNGTLHLVDKSDGKFSLEFKEHNRLDFIAHMIPINYPHETEVPDNDKFLDMLNRIFEGDEHKEDKIQALSEMFGASLIPYFPHLFYLYGESGSGKSTLMIILRMLLGENENICSVQPKHFKGFEMTTMAGKLVNMVTDVDTRTTISDDTIKQIEDRLPVRIQRKFQTDLMAPLPAIHIFGGNDLLKSFEGYSGAFARRWTIIKFNHEHKGPKSRNFAEQVFRKNPDGILKFALSGLKKIIDSNGYFTQFEANKQEISAWAEESDVIGQFLKDAEKGEVGTVFIFDPKARIERLELWKLFSEWQDDVGYKYDKMGKFSFFKLLRKKKFEEKVIGGMRYFYGLGESIVRDQISEKDDIAALEKI